MKNPIYNVKRGGHELAAPVFTQITCPELHRIQLRQDNGVGGGVVLEKHAVVDGHVGGTLLLEDLTLVGEYYGAVDAVFSGFKEFGQRAMLSIVFARLELQRQLFHEITIHYFAERTARTGRP